MPETNNELCWKARFIITQDGHVDLPPDRQHFAGSDNQAEKDAFADDLQRACPARTLFDIIRSKLRAREILTREAAEVILVEADGVRIVGNSNASAGYLYVTATRIG